MMSDEPIQYQEEQPEDVGPVEVFVDPHHRPYRACFKIGVQTFYVCERDDVKEAEWYVGCLQTAFNNYAYYLGKEMAEMLKEKTKEIDGLVLENQALKELIKHAFVAGRGTSTSWVDFAKKEGLEDLIQQE